MSTSIGKTAIQGRPSSPRRVGDVPPSTSLPLAARANQDWAYAPATTTRDWDVRPEEGATTIKAGAWEYYSSSVFIHNAGLPPNYVHVTNWWLLALLGGDPSHGTTGKVKKLYWNPETIKTLTFFGESGSGDHTNDLLLTILQRIYAAHCKTSGIDPSFAGIPFPPGFLVDVRILAETWECKCTPQLAAEAGVDLDRAHVFASNTGGKSPTKKIYLGTHFYVLYRCPFPIWRRAA